MAVDLCDGRPDQATGLRSAVESAGPAELTLACGLQLHTDGVWHDVGSVSVLGAEIDGWRAPTYSGYGVEWAFGHTGARDARALCCQWPVGLEALEQPHWPVFLIDLLPQGFGRQELLGRVGLPGTAGANGDWPLLLVGAGNPIGNLRVKEAAEWLAANPGVRQGFADDEVAQRGEAFAEHLAACGLFVAGSAGVQGEWPKVLLTRARDGLLYLDHTLPDAEAVEQFIVKFGRGPDPQLAAILRHEGPYMALAARLGLRVHAPLVLRGRALFIPRFDRRVRDGGVLRLAQESIATLTGLPGFDAVPSHDTVCRELIRRCSRPQEEVLEYLRRDVANLALGNKHNHARNTALQRDFGGHVALTPLYDFAPMYLHPDGIARRIRWEGNDGGQPDWRRVLDRVCELSAQVQRDAGSRGPGPLQRDALVVGPRAMAPRLRAIAEAGGDGPRSRGAPLLAPGYRGARRRTRRPRLSPHGQTLQQPSSPRAVAPAQAGRRRRTGASEWTLPEAVRHLKKTMRLTTAEMAKLSGVGYRTMQDIEQERSDGSVQTMNRIFGMLGLKLGVARAVRPVGEPR